jgi:hypothetical protein
LTEESGKRQQIQAQLDEANRRIAALAGVTPPDPNAADSAEVRAAFNKYFPHLAQLDDKAIERILRLSEQSQSFEQTQDHYWRAHSQRSMETIATRVAESMGVDKLSDRQQQRIAAAFVQMLDNDARMANYEGRQSELVRRYESGDTSLFESFVKEWVDDWIEPVKRQSIATNVQRASARVPSGKPAPNVVTNNKKPLDFKDDAAVEAAMVDSFRAHGGTFGR